MRLLTGMHLIDMLKNFKIFYRLSRAKRRPIKMATKQDIFMAEILVSRSWAQFNFVFVSEIFLEKNSPKFPLLTFSLRFQKDHFLLHTQ